MKKAPLSLFLAFSLVAKVVTAEKLAIILLDGFNWDYVERMDKADIPAISNLLNNGVRAEYVQSIYPSYHLHPGLSPEKHGIVGNYMWDPKTGRDFALNNIRREGDSSNDLSWWADHVPLWITATNLGIRTSLYLWGKCDVPFNGVLPEKCTTYDTELSIDIDVFENDLLEAADDLSRGFGLVMVYNSNVDEAGHRSGPYTKSLYEEIIEVDKRIQLFLERLEAENLREIVNIIVTTDHGMISNIGQVKSSLTKYISGDLIERAVEIGTFMLVALKDKSLIIDVVRELQAWDGCRAYAKEDIPDHLGFRDHDFILDILIVCDPYNKVINDFDFPQAFLPESGEPADGQFVGDHGYDDTSPTKGEYQEGSVPEMRGIFFASGPKFKSGGQSVNWIKLVDEYQVFLEVLGIEGEEHEGTFSRVEDMFVETNNFEKTKNER